MALSEAEAAAAMDAATSDLKFMMDRQGVPVDLQAKIYNAGALSIAQFACLFKDTEDIRATLKSELGVEQVTLASKAVASKLLVVWQRAKARSEKLAELEGERELRREPKPLQANDFHSMKAAFEAKFWELENKSVPARTYVEKVQEMVEENDLRAELLSEVMHWDDAEPDVRVAVWDNAGNVKSVRSSLSVPLPRDSEELRARIEILGNAWMFVAFQQPNCPFLKGLHPQIFNEYLKYVLGPNVAKLTSKDEGGHVVSTPSWALVLSYEQEIRREALRLVFKGHNLEDPVVKERNFTTPLQLTVRKRSAPEPQAKPAKEVKLTKAEKKPQMQDRGVGKGSAKKGSRAAPCAPKTSDGRNICFSYNRAQMWVATPVVAGSSTCAGFASPRATPCTSARRRAVGTTSDSRPRRP